ncbi:hypothetical protein NB689_002933 [Xanthomonas sacchari]|nr:hypothetical protein [Xanthomonas sacchari]
MRKLIWPASWRLAISACAASTACNWLCILSMLSNSTPASSLLRRSMALSSLPRAMASATPIAVPRRLSNWRRITIAMPIAATITSRLPSSTAHLFCARTAIRVSVRFASKLRSSLLKSRSRPRISCIALRSRASPNAAAIFAGSLDWARSAMICFSMPTRSSNAACTFSSRACWRGLSAVRRLASAKFFSNSATPVVNGCRCCCSPASR